MSEEERDDFQIAFLRCPENGSCLCITTASIYRSTGLEEKVAKGIVAINRCPLQYVSD